MVKLIIAGSRGFDDYELLKESVLRLIEVNDIKLDDLIIISGNARGADLLGEQFALEMDLPVQRYIADWHQYGKSAGYRRNEEMAKIGTHLIAFWDCESKGTKHMIDLANKYGLYINIVNISKSESKTN